MRQKGGGGEERETPFTSGEGNIQKGKGRTSTKEGKKKGKKFLVRFSVPGMGRKRTL